MQRRSFLGAMLAAFAAPAIAKSGVLMPIKPLAPSGYAISDGGLLVPEAFAGPMIRLYTAAGILLASIPLSKQQEAMFDYGRAVAMDFSGQGSVVQTGMASRFELELGPGMLKTGEVGPAGGFNLDNKALVVGQDITIPAMGVRMPQHRQLDPDVYSRRIIVPGEPFDDDDEL